MVKAAVDNDILFKGASFGLLIDLIGTIPSDVSEIGVLGAAPFVVRDKLNKANLNHGPERAIALLEELVGSAVILEPTVEETRFAAELEFAAMRANLNLDEGESQLSAIVIARALSWLATGDKRAIKVLDQLLVTQGKIAGMAGKVLCLEQLFLRLIRVLSAAAVRDAVCREPSIDRALAICFSCYNSNTDPDSWSQGLTSYIADLRDVAKTMLAE